MTRDEREARLQAAEHAAASVDDIGCESWEAVEALTVAVRQLILIERARAWEGAED